MRYDPGMVIVDGEPVETNILVRMFDSAMEMDDKLDDIVDGIMFLKAKELTVEQE